MTPDGQMEFLDQMRRFNLGPAGEADCPVYDGMFEYFQVPLISKTQASQELRFFAYCSQTVILPLKASLISAVYLY